MHVDGCSRENARNQRRQKTGRLDVIWGSLFEDRYPWQGLDDALDRAFRKVRDLNFGGIRMQHRQLLSRLSNLNNFGSLRAHPLHIK